MQYQCDLGDMQGALSLIEELTIKAGEVQEQVLREILHLNSSSEYMSGFLAGGGPSCKVAEAFKKCVPVIDYDQVKPYMDRIARGELSSIICGLPITQLITSSGTSGGQPKIMPSNTEDMNRRNLMLILSEAVANKQVPCLNQGKSMYFLLMKPEIQTASGLMGRTVLTSYYKEVNPGQRALNSVASSTSPDQVILCQDNRQSLYCQLLCGLVHRQDVIRVGTLFGSALLHAIKFFQSHWRSLCADLRAGTLLCDAVDVSDEESRGAVATVLRGPMPELADAVEAECVSLGGAGTWEGIVRRLWPRVEVVEAITTGSMEQYIALLDYYTGGLPVQSPVYASSETHLGINLELHRKPADVAYTLVPNMAYFEFLPVDEVDDDLENHQATMAVVVADQSSPGDRANGTSVGKKEAHQRQPVDLVNVQVGQCYELVVTTYTGLCRYRMGDVLKVTGFYNSAPQFRFMYKRDVGLSLDMAKTSEADFLKAVTAAKPLLHPLGCLLSEYTSYADIRSLPGHYVVFWELDQKQGIATAAASGSDRAAVMEACCEAVEAGLDAVYRRCRSRDQSIGPLEIRVVQRGAFDALMEFCISRGASVSQYKAPRCVKSREVVELLDSMVVETFFSRKNPFWQPHKL